MHRKWVTYILCLFIAIILVSHVRLSSLNKSLEESLDEANNQIEALRIQIVGDTLKEEILGNTAGYYQGNDEFLGIIKDNPIDKDYRTQSDKYIKSHESVTTLMWGNLHVKYTEKWQEEMDAVLECLYQRLNEEEGLILQESQRSWVEDLEENLKFVSYSFVDTGQLGSYGMVRLSKAELKKTRDRAIELMEYLFIIDRDAVKFVYGT